VIVRPLTATLARAKAMEAQLAAAKEQRPHVTMPCTREAPASVRGFLGARMVPGRPAAAAHQPADALTPA
jgi:hypothetical protein